MAAVWLSIFGPMILAHLLLWGNAYVEKSFSAGRLVALTPLMPGQFEKKRRENGAFFYAYTDAKKGRRREIEEGNMMHIPAFTMDGLIGLSVIGWMMTLLLLSLSVIGCAASARVG